jgi:hypothetical protein
MNWQLIKPLLVGGLARLISKGLILYFGIEAAKAGTDAEMYANALGVIIIGIAELVQSHYAHKLTAEKAKQ